MKKLYSTTNQVFLALLKSKLVSEKIPTIIANADPPAAGEVPPLVAWPELWVIEDAYYERAKALVQVEVEKLEVPHKAWCCSHCGEWLEGQFDVCWACGEGRGL